jgi:hypothetical protein
LQVNIHKPKVGEEDDDETLVTIKGETAQIGSWDMLLFSEDAMFIVVLLWMHGTDKACETINTVFAQFAAQMKARRAAGKWCGEFEYRRLIKDPSEPASGTGAVEIVHKDIVSPLNLTYFLVEHTMDCNRRAEGVATERGLPTKKMLFETRRVPVEV